MISNSKVALIAVAVFFSFTSRISVAQPDVPLYADIGTGGGPNRGTWQASTGVGVSLSKMIDISLTYRALGFDIKSGPNNSTLLKGLFHGPQVMATVNF